MILAIDPGPTESAYVVWDGRNIQLKGKVPNEHMVAVCRDVSIAPDHSCVIEQLACYGMPVGAEVLETAYWSGIFAQVFGRWRVDRIPRLAVKMHLCHDSRAKDANIRQALIDRFGKPGTKHAPGVLYGVAGDIWAALAVAVTWWDGHNAGKVAA